MTHSIIIKGVESLTRRSNDLNWLRPSDHNLERIGSQGIHHVAETRYVVENIAEVGLLTGTTRSTSKWKQRIDKLALSPKSDDLIVLAERSAKSRTTIIGPMCLAFRSRV